MAVGRTTELGNGEPGVLAIAASPQRWRYSIEGPGSTFRAVVIDPRLDAPNPEALARFHGRHGANARDGTQRRVATLEASSVCLDRVAGPRWHAVGDAAAAFDPFSGQGLGQAFGSALAAAHAIRADAGGDTDAFAIYAGAVHATYRHSRHLLDRRYAFVASREGGPFWRERVRHALASTTTAISPAAIHFAYLKSFLGRAYPVASLEWSQIVVDADFTAPFTDETVDLANACR